MTHTNKPLGRPSLATGRKDAIAYIRVTVEQKKRLEELGGAKWVRRMIDNSGMPLISKEECRSALHASVMRALDEAGVRSEVLRGMCLEVAMETLDDYYVK